MKRITAIVLAIVLILLLSTSVLAASLNISPPTVEFEVPANGSTEVTFIVSDFTGDINIDCENIPLKVEPAKVSVKAREGGDEVVLKFYGDESLGSKIYEGKIRFLAMTGGTVAMGIKVKAKVTNLVKGETPVLATPEKPPPPAPAPSVPAAAQSAPTPPAPTPPAVPTPPAPETPASAPLLPPYPPRSTGLPIIPIAGIAAGAAIVITLIIVVATRRNRY